MTHLDKSGFISEKEMIEVFKNVGPLLLHYKGGLYLITGTCLIHHPTEPSKPGYNYLHLWPHAQVNHARGVDEFYSETTEGQLKWRHLNPEIWPLPVPPEPR